MLAGTPLNVVRMGAHASPALFEAQGKLGYAVADPSVLTPRIRETVILRVAYLSGSEYELHHHIPLARAAGLTQAEMEAIETARYAALDPVLAAVCRFTGEVVLLITPSDATLGGVACAGFGPDPRQPGADHRLLYVDCTSHRGDRNRTG